MKKASVLLVFLLIQFFICRQSYSQDSRPKPSIHLRTDATEKFQQLDGFGVNINTAWWYKGKYGDAFVVQPAIDQLIDSLGATIFRAVIEEIDWEQTNDNDDPDNFNWDYYNKVFTSARFEGVWNTLHYLNKKGITKGLILSFMGAPPAAAPLARTDQNKSWMGGTDYSINPSMENEFVEQIAAMLYYARNTAKVEFSLVSPMNETEQIAEAKSADHPNGVVEGPNMPDAVQFVRLIKKLAQKLDAIGMSDIRFVAPDAAGEPLFHSCLQEIVKDPYLMEKLAYWGVHEYGKSAGHYYNIIKGSEYPDKSYVVTETAGIGNMLTQLADSAKSYIFWDGFDCVYQHARRNGYGDNPPNDWVFWQPEDGKPLLEYIPDTKSWRPRKQFYEFAQLYHFIKPGAIRIGLTGTERDLVVRSFLNPDGQLVIVGFNSDKDTININGTLDNLRAITKLGLVYTSPEYNLHKAGQIQVKNNVWDIIVPPNCIFTLTGYPDSSHFRSSALKPEPDDWFAGDIHVHRNCGEGTSILAESEFTKMMEPNDLAVISVLSDMGDGEVKDCITDLPKVNGTDAVQSRPGRIVHYDAEWHFDPAGTTFEHKALGGHLVMLGLKEAHTIWDESPYKILGWGKQQNAIMGFCHMQYLKDSIPGNLDCCTPIDFPVEAALGTIDFLAEDVWLNDASVKAYYRLLNCGFKLGWAAGTDFPCNNNQPFGSLLTYVQVKDTPLTYTRWIEGIKDGRTVVTTNGHQEFLDLKINGTSTPGDEIILKEKGTVGVEVRWISISEQTGRIELVLNGKVIATQQGISKSGEPVILKAKVPVSESSWICARRMDDTGHRSHTAPVYITLGSDTVRASAEDARYFITWIDNMIANISPGGQWNKYFTHDLGVVRKRYLRARAIYEKIAIEADKKVPPILVLSSVNDFGSYSAEILKTEGFNEFISDSISDGNITESYLARFDLIILAESRIEGKGISLLSEYVKNGGRLIVLRPVTGLSELSGVTPTGKTISSGYIGIDTGKELGRGLPKALLQVHEKTEYYRLKGSSALAYLFASRAGTSSYPSAVKNNYGKGQTITFLYDLPRNIVLTRQGNPALAGLEKDGILGLRGMDLFTDGWVDTSNSAINQSDVQMALLSHCVENLTGNRMPLPRFWYFPDTLKCLVTLTNDGEYKSESDFEPQFSDVDSSGAKMSLYILGVDKVSKAWVDKWTARGFEIAGHPDDTKEAGNPGWNTMDSALSIRKNEINTAYGLPMRTNVNHWFVWCGRNEDGSREFAAEAKLEEMSGIEMDINYSHYDIKSNQGEHYLGSPGLQQGNFTGSGLVMKFADSNGKTVNVYQHLNAVYDQEYNESKDPEGFFNCFKGLMDRSIHNEVYSFISVKSHNDEYYFSRTPLLKMLTYARQNNIPVRTELNLLDFLKMKDNAYFSGFNWLDKRLTFKLSSNIKYSGGLTFLLPFIHNNLKIKDIVVGGKSRNFAKWKIRGYDYALVTVTPGRTYDISVKYE